MTKGEVERPPPFSSTSEQPNLCYPARMKFGELTSIAHNISDSLASGIGFLAGVYEMDIFGEARATPDGFIEVDFLSGTTTGGRTSESLANGIRLYAQALPGFCERHGADIADFTLLKARFATDAVYGPHYTVTVENQSGRRSTDQYRGVPGKRLRMRQKP